MEAYSLLYYIAMLSFFKASKYGKSDMVKQLSQRVANVNDPFDMQSGFIYSDFSRNISDLLKFANVHDNDEIISHAEGIIALMITIGGCNSYKSICSAIYLYARKYMNRSLSNILMTYVEVIFDYSPQSDSDKNQRNWTQLFKDAKDNWSSVKNNKLFDQFSKLLGVLVTVQLCSISDVTFSLKGFKLFEPDMKVVHGNAMDIVDAILSTSAFFVERITLCWEAKSLYPLLVDKEITLDEKYSDILMQWELVKNGNLFKVANKSDHEFDKNLEDMLSELKILLNSVKGYEKKIISDRYVQLLKIKNDFVTMKISSGVRAAPYCIEFFGASSQGKTTLAEQIVQALLVSAGLPTGKEYQASYNASDKFMSSWSTNKVVLTIDDMANDKSNFVERPPTRAIIDICNNQPFYANMADLDKKGKIFVEPEICVVTTNVKDLKAGVYSNCPYSVQRRMHAVLTVKAKAEFQYTEKGSLQGIDPMKVYEYNKKNPNTLYDDIWDITIERATQPSDLRVVADYTPIKNEQGKEMKDISFREAAEFLIVEFGKHREAQDNIVNRMNHRKEMVRCPVANCNGVLGLCSKHDMRIKQKKYDEHVGEETRCIISNAGLSIYNKLVQDIFGFEKALNGICAYMCYRAIKSFDKHWDWVKFIPTPMIDNDYVLKMLFALNFDRIKHTYIMLTICNSIMMIAILYKCFVDHIPMYYGIFIILNLFFQKNMFVLIKKYMQEMYRRRNRINPLLRHYRDEHIHKICAASVVLGSIYTLSKIYRSWRAICPHGSLEPITKFDIDERDNEENVWTTVVKRDLPITNLAANTTPEQLRHLVRKNLVYGSVHLPNKTLRVNGLFLTSNVIAIPNHYFEQDTLDITFRKNNPEAGGGKFAARVTKQLGYLIPDSDIRICYVSTGGSFKNLSRYLPVGNIGEVEFSVDWRNKEGELYSGDGLCETKFVSNGAAHFLGLNYKTLTINTFQGMCGATLISKRKALILGMHLGGFADTPRGCAGIISHDDFTRALQYIRSKEGTLVTGSAEKFEAQVLGVKVINDETLHKKSPLNYMPNDSQVEYYGSCPGMSTFKSNVKVTKISEHVSDVLDSPNIYRGPVEEPQYFGWQTCLSNLAVPATPYDPLLLDLAIVDYKVQLIDLISKDMWNDMKPLNHDENMNGIAGKKFLDAINMATSIGYPLVGAKSKFLVDGEKRAFTDEIYEEINRCETCYRRGERAYTIAKACKKDEVLSKPKCRIFYGNPIALTFLIRKYYLPILRFLQFNPKISECAVGINCHGPEWEELHHHILHFGKDRLIGGDYGKYDQKLPSQLILAALRIMIDLARECNYSSEDISIMEAMAGDIVYAIIAYNGDLIGLTEGTHISGNSLTVIINGICGSLNLRCYFKENYPDLEFRDFVKLVTYGDDNIGSVSPKIDNFTIKGASDFLSKYGQVYTMPDKESELLNYLPPDDFEFLKRSSNWIPEIQQHVGALSEKSCQKMLHCYLRDKNSPLTEEHACAINIDTALREWFNHGREVYEERRKAMKEIANRASIAHLCMELDTDFNECVNRWKSKYAK